MTPQLVRAARAAFAALLALVSLGACRPAGGAVHGLGDLSSRRIRAVATTGMVADLVKNVGGDRVELQTLMGPGVDPHLYRATEGDVIRIGGADVVFYSGLHLEAKMADVFERLRSRVRTVAVTDAIDRDLLLTPAQFQGNYDPHVWFDVRLWMQAATKVEDALIAMDPQHERTYRGNARAYLERLGRLDRYVRAQARRVPRRARVLITAHDAFNYFGRAYGFEVRGLQGISTAAEAGTADVSTLAEFVVDRRIPAMFVESSVPPRFIEAVQEAVRARGFDVAIGGQLYSDAMGDPGTPEGTYVGMVRHNIDSIVAGLLQDEAAL